MRSRKQPGFNKIIFLIITFTAIFSLGCGRQEKPPFFTAKVLDLWGQITVVENFKIYYSWEERGETPFLKPYSYHAKEIIVEVMLPVPGETNRVTMVTKKIPLQDIHTLEIIRGEAVNSVQIHLKNNEQIIATDRFPQILKKGVNTGFADYAIFIEGIVEKDGKRGEFKLSLDRVKKVEIVKVAMHFP